MIRTLTIVFPFLVYVKKLGRNNQVPFGTTMIKVVPTVRDEGFRTSLRHVNYSPSVDLGRIQMEQMLIS